MLKIKKILSAIIGLVITTITLSANADPLPSKSKIMLVGDSLAVGLAPRFRVMSKEMEYVPIVAAIGGTTTAQWSGMIKSRIDFHRPELLLISLGTNDSGFWGKSFVENTEKLDKLLSIAKESGAKVVWIGVPPMPAKKLPYAIQVADTIKSKVEFYFESREYQFQRAEDKIHFTANGYSDWMDSIWDYLYYNELIINPNEEDF